MTSLGAWLSTRVLSVLSAIVVVLSIGGCGSIAKEPTSVDLPFLTAEANDSREDGSELRVTSVRKLSERSYLLSVSTPAIDPSMTIAGNNVVITLPTHFTSSVRYPAIYLLHGSGEDGNAEQWYEAGKIETLLGEEQAIAIMPDGGKAGWYTDWPELGAASQKWQTYHLNQLIPWIDARLPTINSRSARAIAGISMGGYGAIRYAEIRPDLFSKVASFSGLLSLESASEREIITAESAEVSGRRDAIFGTGWQTTQQQWSEHDPLTAASALTDTEIFIYSGPGGRDKESNGGLDLEKSLRASSDSFTAKLSSLGIDYTYDALAVPGDECDGGHNWGCWSSAAARIIPGLIGGLEPASVAK